MARSWDMETQSDLHSWQSASSALSIPEPPAHLIDLPIAIYGRHCACSHNRSYVEDMVCRSQSVSITPRANAQTVRA